MDRYTALALRVIEASDIVCEVLDSRFPELTRIEYLERQVHEKEKTLIYVFNKCDLISLERAKKLKKQFSPSVFVSAVKRYGITILKKKLIFLGKTILWRTKQLASKKNVSKDKVIVGIVGYPNTGKSSIINALGGARKARVSPMSGFTKGFQYVRLNRNIRLIDSPGVIPFNKKDEVLLGIIGGLDPDKMKDPVRVGEVLLDNQKESILKFYGVYSSDLKDSSGERLLELLGISLNYLRSKGKVDLERTAKKLIRDWQRGKIHLSMMNETQINEINQMNEQSMKKE